MDPNESMDLSGAQDNGTFRFEDKRYPVKIGIEIVSSEQVFSDYSPVIESVYVKLGENGRIKWPLQFNPEKSNIIKNFDQIQNGDIIHFTIEYFNEIICNANFIILDKNEVNKQTGEISPIVQRMG